MSCRCFAVALALLLAIQFTVRGQGSHARRDQGDRRGRLHLRPADRDELCGQCTSSWIDKTSSQYKARSTSINNEARVFTYKDTAVVTPNSDTPYSFVWFDLRAEPMVLSVPAVRKIALLLGACSATGNTFNYGYIGSRATGNEAGDYLVVGPDWKGETPAGIKKVSTPRTQFSLAAYRTQLFNPADMPNVVKVQAGYKVQPLSAYLKQPAPPAAPAINFPTDRQGDGEDELLRVSRLRAAIRPGRAGGKGDPREACARIGIGRRQDVRLQGSLTRAQGRSRLGMKDGEAKIEGVLTGGTRDQRLADWLALRRPRLLQRRLAEARRRRQGGHLRQRRRRSHVSA